MKLFLRKIFLFISVPLLIIIIILISYKYSIYNFDIHNSEKTLIIGDSHTQTAINDSILDNSINVSQSGQHFLYTYNVLRVLLENNEHIDNVVLGVSFHSFGASRDEHVKNSSKTRNSFPRYYPVLNFESFTDVSLISPHEFRLMLINVLDTMFSSNIHAYPFIGRFYDREGNNLNSKSISANIEGHYFTEDGRLQGFSDLQVEYLQKISDLCKDNEIQLILINTPKHSLYNEKIPNEFVDKYYDIIHNIKSENVSFIDLHAYKLPDDNYGDGDHLNAFGAKKISEILDKQI